MPRTMLKDEHWTRLDKTGQDWTRLDKTETIYKAYQRWFCSNKLMALFTL
ncbi:IS5/IS1182 family transposase, partial [Psychrobacter celer]